MATDRRSMREKDIAFHFHPFTNPSVHEVDGPQVIERGDGIYLIDSDGKKYIDGMSSLWCCSLGYSETRLINAAHQQLQTLPYCHTFRGRSHPNLIDLAEQLVKLAPNTMSKVFFANSGSEANDTAIKIAWHYNNVRGKPYKNKIISRNGGYHGSTIITASLSGLPYMHAPFNLPLDGILFADCPHYYRHALHGETEEGYSERLADNLDQLIVREGADNIAALIAEPVMGVGGVIIPPETYFEKIQQVLRSHDILMIADEVICGFGRTGNMFGSTTFKIEPDIISIAKGLSSAYFPVSGVMISGDVYDVIVDSDKSEGMFSHGFTYSGHPVGAGIALEALRIYEERDICAHVCNVGKVFATRLRQLLSNSIVGEVRNVGLMGGIELVSNKDTKESFPATIQAGERVVERAESYGLFIRCVGSSLVVAPPLIVTETELSDLFDRLEKSIYEISNELSIG